MESYLNKPITKKIADDILANAYGSEEFKKLCDAITTTTGNPPKDVLIQQTYQKKINWYQDRIWKKQAESQRLIKDVNSDPKFNMDTFISKAEKIGIDIMNDQTIVDMLTKQYRDWFGKEPEKPSYIDGDML